MLQKIQTIFHNARHDMSYLHQDYTRMNINRAYKAYKYGIILIAIVVVVFSFFPTQNMVWKMRLLWCNIILFVFMSIMILLLRYLLRVDIQKLFSRVVPYLSFVVFIAYSIYISANDQVITGNITTYVMACLILGTVYLMHPFHSILLFIFAFLAFCCFVSPMAPTVSYQLLNLTNALTMTIVSMSLSVIMWHYNRTDILQKKQILSQQEQLEKANHELHQMAYYDSLTSLPNRRYFENIVRKETALMCRKDFESCLIMLDIDYFKRINDRHGHPVGDKLLIQIGNLLSQNIRIYDTLCRFGGEEFIILLPQTSMEDAVAVANKLLLAISSQTFIVENHSLNITVSIGVSRLCKDADALLTEQYTLVDNALYMAKNDGRNCVRIA